MQDRHLPPANDHAAPRAAWGIDPTSGKAIPERLSQAYNERRCWCCGEPMSRYVCFGIDVVSALTRTSPTPGAHETCLELAAAGAFPLMPWPAVGMIWRAEEVKAHWHDGAVRFEPGEPNGIAWLRPGGARPSMAEAHEAINMALPPLVGAVVERGTEEDAEQLNYAVLLLHRYLPLDRVAK